MAENRPFPTPAPVSIDGLRTYFRSTYQLGEQQVELMINSSRKSLEKILAEARLALQSEEVCGEMVHIGHNLKGLLLNMGEPEWAELARELEHSARAGIQRDYVGMIDQFVQGMTAVLTYGEGDWTGTASGAARGAI